MQLKSSDGPVCYSCHSLTGGMSGMIAIAAAVAFVLLFIAWVVLPRKFLKNK